ncbi:hypothetical protein POSPLADRAFT_1048467 [Postia placenta MAD-698-R-SB12]|uniref:Rho termination factor N-terminal domain-containing protein n=1 Tax=Postia placenta MAD-698-R-SB12 TaxID=670580 RepID=A0A1X6MV08_9APHY|nr:hypothetical protein POSPLADRAFT_1048467 [Postia placenta MAD-698-R-SB12]OSX60033.1 hypothetical protein POSPLADRAFT_1048467 [Postia placenta MAD-698-R-SB12]
MAENASNAVTPMQDLGKLTVPQLKALCKERKITGYSKLGKNALIDKLRAVTGEVISKEPSAALAIKETSVHTNGGSLVQPSVNADRGDSSVLSSAHESQGKAKVNYAKEPPAQKSDLTSKKPKATKVKKPKNPVPRSSITQVLKSNTAKPLTSTSSAENLRPISVDQAADDVPTSECMLSLVPHIEDTATASISTSRPEHETCPGIAQETSAPAASISIASVRTVSAGRKRLSTASISASKRQRTENTCVSTKTSMPPLSSTLRPRTDARLHNQPTPTLSSGLAADPPARTMIQQHHEVIRKTQQVTTSLPFTGKRFKKLVVLRPPNTGSAIHMPEVIPADFNPGTTATTAEDERPFQETPYLEFPPSPRPPELASITLPPSLSQRKRVHRWAVILSGLSNEERKQCVLVSRMFRYAVYLSASHTLKSQFDGRRLQDEVLKRYSLAMTNMWPYLRLRQAEVAQRQQAYDASFLARFMRGKGLPDPIAINLWVSPDNERQIAIAIRFVMSRLWFALSIGIGRSDSEIPQWLCDVVADVQEVVKGEIWSVSVVSPHSKPQGIISSVKETFYVLESTCEVVGRQEAQEIPVRADWSEYVSRCLQSASSATIVHEPLSRRLKWANHEEYEKGISRLWLKRIASEGPIGTAKRTVAERYVMACVVANSVSGQWKTATEMAQDFAGLQPRIGKTQGRCKPPSINLYLPEPARVLTSFSYRRHHYIESVHFTVPGGQRLHPALAVVQTPHREYYILRDNGMQVGCEEDGVGQVWQEVVGCDALGCRA